MSRSRPRHRACLWGLIPALAVVCARAGAAESPYIYGIHDHDTGQQEWLDHIAGGGATGWVTATVAIGHNPNDYGGDDFSWISNQGHTVICRLNNGYGESGTIPVPDQYGNFAQRCANYVNASSGCNHYIIGNETNLSCEWPKVGGWRSYLSPQSYADCFRQCHDAIKGVDPNAKVICQALAPFAGPYGPGADHDGNPLGWTDYMNQMLTAINSSGGIDGIAAHINSRGYTYADVHSTQKVNGQYFSFYVYKDWVSLGTPASMRTLPYYATECNGIYYWKGGHPECSSCSDPRCCYTDDWIEWIYEEIDNWNQTHASSGEGIYRCVNMYRWCAWCDDWNIDGSPPKGQMLTDLDDAVVHLYRWDEAGPPNAAFVGSPRSGTAPLTVDFTDQSTGLIDTWSWSFGDTGTSEEQDPSHEYADPGLYTVSLTVTGPGGNDTETKTEYITVDPGQPGENLITNGDFGDDLDGWTIWIERNTAGDFSASVVSGELRETGSNYNAGVWQQFGTGGAGTYIDIAGLWRSNPTVAEYQWGEVIIINSGRTPVDGVDEGGQADDVLVYKNDTWTSPGGWNGQMADTAPVANVKTFVADGNTATILLKSGNTGGTSSGVVFDDITVTANQPPTADIQVDTDNGPAPLEVHFDATGSTDPENDPLDYDWDFGDDETGEGAITDHTFTTPDTYLVTLTVDDGRGGTDIDTVQITVTEPAQGCTGDFDDDGDVDMEDFGLFQRCLSGDGFAQEAPECLPTRLDEDDDVDQHDFDIFEACLSGADITPPPECCPG